MSTAEQRLRVLLEYYQITRRIGHTEAMMSGAKGWGRRVAILAGEMKTAVELCRRCNGIPLSMSTLTSGIPMGLRAPLLVDNSAVIAIIADALNYVREEREASFRATRELKSEHVACLLDLRDAQVRVKELEREGLCDFLRRKWRRRG